MNQGREKRNPMQVYPQATKLSTVPFIPASAKATLKSHWCIRGQKGLWKFVAVTGLNKHTVKTGELLAWFYSSWNGASTKVNYGRFIRDTSLEEALKRLLK